MILGVLSDSHGRGERTARAVQLLKRLGATHFAHCGDICGESVLDALAGLPLHMVWGNNDVGDHLLARYALSIGIAAPQAAPATFEFGGARFALFHGHEEPFAKVYRAAQRGDDDLIDRLTGGARWALFGHTHLASDHRVGRVRFVNPGALQRAQVYTVATIDPTTDEVTHWVVGEIADESSTPLRYTLPR